MNNHLTALLLGASLLGLLLGSGCATTKALQAELDACNGGYAQCQDDLESCQDDLASADTARDLVQRRMAAYRALADRLEAAFSGGDLEILIRNGRLVVQLPNRILYDTGSFELRPEGADVVRALAAVLSQVPDRQFLIAGHTDDRVVKPTAPYKSNWELSTLRALSVVYLMVDEGVPVAQLGATGYGEFHPDAPNDTEEGKQENRRTEIIIMPTLDEIPKLPRSL